MLVIKGNINLEKIEELNRQIWECDPNDAHLQIPQEINGKKFAVVVSLIQTIGTWLRNHPNANLYTLLDSTKASFEEDCNLQVDDELAFACIVMAWKRKIFDINNINIKFNFKKPTERIFNQMKYIHSTQMKGNKLFLTCFDGINTSKGLLNCFYLDNKNFVREADLSFTLEKAITENVLKQIKNSGSAKGINSVLDDFKGIIYELMHNTDQWARTNEKNDILYPNIRGVYMQFHKGKRENFLKEYKNSKGLSSYFQNDIFKANSNNELYFVELSIFDTGPGYIRRFTGKSRENINEDEEVLIVKQCLTKKLSSQVNNLGTRGYGLSKIVSLLSGRGFIRIRTGQRSLYRDMISFPFQVLEDEEDNIRLFDWFSNSDQSFTKMPDTEGAVITIVYPLDFVSFAK